jgi:hypothetical protein
MNTESCVMIRTDDDESIWDGTAGPGSFFIDADPTNGQRRMWFVTPDGQSGVINLRPVAPGNEAHPSWEWDGDENRPTLTPSVHAPGRWHGFFKAGRMESC